MHPIELAIHKFLADISSGQSYKIPLELLDKFGTETRAALSRQFEREPQEFSLRMSSIGKPLCQLQLDSLYGYSGMEAVRSLLGDLVEDITLFLLHASGINVVAELLPVSLDIGGISLKGTLDVILEINGRLQVYDIKSASDYSFKSKGNQTFDEFVAQDTFGYVSQLFCYTEACKKDYPDISAGGWIFMNKSSAELKVISVPDGSDRYREDALRKVEYNIRHIKDPFQRSFTDLPESFRKKPTGNKVLGFACSWCDHKFRCWPGLSVSPQLASTSKNPKLLYYTEIKESKNAA